jgi:hypothetical protein
MYEDKTYVPVKGGGYSTLLKYMQYYSTGDAVINKGMHMIGFRLCQLEQQCLKVVTLGK